ncbi:MAG: CvpA family protein [Clostridiales bacterium]|nr:CvpA family protein [Clostridiales bacterium]
MSYFDIAIIVIVALGALIGLWKGFFKTFISFFGWTASFLIAFFLTKPVANALLDVAKIRHFVLGTGGGWSLFQWISGQLPSLESNGFIKILLTPLINTCNKAGVLPALGVPLLLANGMFSAIVCLAMFLIIRLFMLFFTLFANAMTKGKFKGALNRLLGFIFGAVKGGATVCFIMVFCTFIMGLSFMAPARKQLDKSVIAQPVYKQVVKYTDKYLAGNDDTLTKLLHHLGLELGSEDDTPAYCGTYSGSTTNVVYTAGGTYTATDDGITYTLVLDEESETYELTAKDGDAEAATVENGAYEVGAGNEITFIPTGSDVNKQGTLDGNVLTYDGRAYQRQGGGTEVTTTYTLILEKDGNYTLRVMVSTDPDHASATAGTYVWDEENHKLTLSAGGAEEEYDVNSNGSIDYDDVVLVKGNS